MYDEHLLVPIRSKHKCLYLISHTGIWMLNPWNNNWTVRHFCIQPYEHYQMLPPSDEVLSKFLFIKGAELQFWQIAVSTEQKSPVGFDTYAYEF